MFTRFTTGQGRTGRRRGTMLASVAVHAGVAWLAAVAAVRGDPRPPEPPPAVLIYHPPPPASIAAGPAPGAPASPGAPGAPAPPRIADALDGSGPWVVLPDVPPIAEPGPAAPGPGLAVGSAGPAGDVGIGGGAAAGGPADGVWDGARVDVEARARPGNPPPRYPAALEERRAGGTVVARFVVDSTGTVEPGSLVLRASDHPLLAESVRRALPRYRFEPARVRGRAVRQLVELPFVFTAP